MKIKLVATATLLKASAPYNPRKISEEEMTSLRRSMRYFGVVEPIVYNTRTKHVVGGHQRIEAAGLERIDKLPTFEIDVDLPTEKQLNLALNRISGTWDEDKLAALLAELQGSGASTALTGFRDSEVEKFVQRLRDVPTAEQDDTPEQIPKRAKPGDLWHLGEHRLLCGDSSDARAHIAVLGTARPHLVVCDPPEVGAWDGAVKLAAERMRPGASFYGIADGDKRALELHQAMEAAGIEWHQTLVWVKDRTARDRQDYHAQHELVLYGWRPGRHYFIGDRTRTSILEAAAPAGERKHPGMKPLALWEELIGNSTTPGQAVFDPHAGTGTTIIAAERLGRRGFAVELEPANVDLAIARWEELTSKKATKGDAP